MEQVTVDKVVIDWCQDHVDREGAEDIGLQRELGRV